MLADDFGFKAAVSSADIPTITSALDNHAARADASIAIFVATDGNIASSLSSIEQWRREASSEALLARVKATDFVLAVTPIAGEYIQLVSVPVMVPHKIGWLLMGFSIDDRLAAEFRSLTGLDITVFARRDARNSSATSTLDPRARKELLAAIGDYRGASESPFEISISDSDYLTRLKPLDSVSGVLAVGAPEVLVD